MNAVAILQSAIPKGLNTGTRKLPKIASKLSAGCETRFNLTSKDCKNQITIVAQKIIVKALLKVVLDDISFEIYNLQEYMYYLLDNIDRLNKAKKYFDKMKSAKSENKREYFLEYGKMYLITNEQPENVEKIISEYQEAYTIRKEKINKLLNEKKIIKNLKV